MRSWIASLFNQDTMIVVFLTSVFSGASSSGQTPKRVLEFLLVAQQTQMWRKRKECGRLSDRRVPATVCCRLPVSTWGSLLLMGLGELCRFPNKEIDRRLVWAGPASVHHEARLPTVLWFPFIPFTLCSASSCPDWSCLDADYPTSATRSGSCLLYFSFFMCLHLVLHV